MLGERPCVVMAEEPELDEVARRESRERVRRILDTLAASRESRWREVYRDAHTLAGIAPDAEMARSARELASLVSDARGRVRASVDEAEALRLGRRLSERLSRLDDQA